jgi:RNase adaptor protein for sRNA GlmZ degradation
MIRIVSFGYGHGAPPAADITYDLRAVLHNPHHDPAMRDLTGLDDVVYDHVMTTPGARQLAVNATRTARRLAADTGTDLVIGWACTGGRHRSVALARRMQDLLQGMGIPVTVEHRDVYRQLLPAGVHARPRT